MNEHFQGGKCSGTGQVDTRITRVVPSAAIQAGAFSVQRGGAPFMVHDPIGSQHKLISGENSVLNLADQVFNNSGSDLGVTKSDGSFSTHRMCGRFQPFAGGFF